MAIDYVRGVFSRHTLSPNRVKTVKSLLKKTDTFDQFKVALTDRRNMPRFDGLFPAQWYLGYRQTDRQTDSQTDRQRASEREKERERQREQH